MPKYFIQLGSREQSINSALPITHCLTGKRDDAFQKPSGELIAKTSRVGNIPVVERSTKEEITEVSKWRWQRTHGFYSPQALGWVESEAEGEALKAKFPAPEWDQASLVLMPVQVIAYG